MTGAPAARPVGLVANLLAGARLVLFRPVTASDFAVGPAQFVALAAFNVALAALGAFLRNGVPGTLDLDALQVVLAQFALVLLFALAIAHVVGRPESFLLLATMLIAGDAVFEVVAAVLHFVSAEGLVGETVFGVAGLAYLGWGFVTMVRALRVAIPWQRPQSVYAVGLLAVLFGLFVSGWLRADLWVAEDEGGDAQAEGGLSIVQEEVFHRQQTLLDDQLDALKPERPGETDLYFLGVAPNAPQDVFVREMATVRALFDERFGTRGRSLVLANSPATLADTPIASVTQLRYALAEIGRIMNPDEDVLFLFISTHGDAEHQLAFELDPLALDPLTPTALARMLHDAGVKWRVIVISACYSGGFVAPLEDPSAIVITAADADSTSSGCENGNDFTYFGRAYFDEALRETHSFAKAFEAARRAIAEREQREHLAPSSPQMFVGAAIGERLTRIEAQLR
jgi:hypothetical protein